LHAAFLINPLFLPGIEERFAGAAAAANSLIITLQRVAATTPAELNAAFATIEDSSSQAVLVQNDPMLSGTVQSRILDFGLAHRLPTIWENKDGVARGGLFRYGIDQLENARRAAGYVAKILNGAKPADLPVQRPTKFLLVINLKAAKALGLTVPQSLLARADEVIE
jgi:putative tryptophan/tyrosine transport system substrate-binding protein